MTSKLQELLTRPSYDPKRRKAKHMSKEVLQIMEILKKDGCLDTVAEAQLERGFIPNSWYVTETDIEDEMI